MNSTKTATQISISDSVEIQSNPLNLKAGDSVMMDEVTPVNVIRIGHKGFLAVVEEIKSKVRWTVSIGCLSL